MYLASCELHIQTLMFLIVLTLKQYVNGKTIWGREVRDINAMTMEKQVVFELSLHFTPGLQSSVWILPLVCT